MIHHTEGSTTRPGRIVILGGSGFVGRWLLESLRPLQIETVPLSSTQLDLRAPEAVAFLHRQLGSGDALVFCSALTPDKGRDSAALMNNLRMGYHVAAALEKSACRHVVYISSDAVYEDSPNPVREDTPPAPSSLYALMHLTREKMLAAAVSKANSPLLILRPCAIYGPGDTHNSYGPNRFLRSARREGRIVLFGQGEEKRHHLFIRDFVAVIVECLSRGSHGIGTIAGAEAVTFADLAGTICRLVQPVPRVESLPRQGGSITHRHFDLTAYLKAFPHLPLTPLEQGLRRTLAEMTS